MLRKKYLLLLILIILSTKLFSISKIDSLEAVLNHVDGKERMTVLNKLSLLYIRINPEISYDCAAQALELAKKNNDEKGRAYALNNIGNYFRITYDYDEALEFYQQALDIYRKLKLDRKIANVYDNIGHIHWFTGNFSKALDYYTRSLGMFIALDDQKRQSFSYNNLGSVYFRLGMYDESMRNFLNSLSIREKTDDPKIHSTLNNLGNIYVRISDYEKALEMYERSLEYKRKSKISTQSTLNNIGNIYLNLEDYESALRYLSEALKINEEKKDEKRIAISLNNIAVVFEEQGKIDEALYNYQKALVLKQKVGDKYGYANTSKNLGNIFLLKKDYAHVDHYLGQSLKIAEEIKARDIIKSVYELMSIRYAEINDYSNAYLFQTKCSSVRDSLFNEETSEKITQYRTNFTIEKTLREKEILIKNNQIYKLQLQKNKSFRFILFLLLLILVMIALFLYYNYNKKKKLNKILGLTNDELEDQVAVRTLELVETNENLRNEIEVRNDIGKKLESSLNEKDVMLKEIHHRVKNNLQIISSILNIQSRSSTNEESLRMFTNMHNRVMSMSLVQEQLYLSDDLAVVDINQYVRSLIINIFSSYHISHSRITPIINIKEIYLNINTAIPCGLLINEIVTNSIKHGFNGNKKGEIIINMKEGKDNYFHLEISNNGEGLPDGIDYTNPESTGMELIRILILQLSADADLVKENGVLYKLKFKKLKN
ncbi:MAG: tetratricopeptide repeat protein [Candidatus Cloacimonetes bacterium]|nr:tetratricopeptide repeat protein [Candidatus Cloacimonadota bacterium]